MLKVERASSSGMYKRFGWWRIDTGSRVNVYRTLDKYRAAFDSTHRGHLFHLGPINLLFLRKEQEARTTTGIRPVYITFDELNVMLQTKEVI